jgi:hypothetical protein
MSKKISNDTILNRTSDLPICSTYLNHCATISGPPVLLSQHQICRADALNSVLLQNKISSGTARFNFNYPLSLHYKFTENVSLLFILIFPLLFFLPFKLFISREICVTTSHPITDFVIPCRQFFTPHRLLSTESIVQ